MFIFHGANDVYIECLSNEKKSGKEILDELKKNPECLQLIQEAQMVLKELKLPPLEIRIEKTKNGFPSEQDCHIIRISPERSSSEQLGYAIMELTNVIQHERHVEVDRNITQYISAEEYAKAHELIEYEGVIKCNEITRKINIRKGSFFKPFIKNDWEYFPVQTMGFDLYYHQFLADHHKEFYRKYWRIVNNKTKSFKKYF